MINASELRIGNFVFGNAGSQIIVTSYQLHYWDGNLKPIPLTEEWMLRFGFHRGDCEMPDNSGEYRLWASLHLGIVEIEYYHIGVDGRADKFTFEFEGTAGDECAVEIQSVHQLQNLYFALTGEELQIKTLVS